MSRYINRDGLVHMRRPLGYTLGDVNDPNNPSILFGDPTFGSRDVIEQVAGINQAFDPGMSFGTVTPADVHALTPDELAHVGLSAATGGLPLASFPNTAAAQPPWLRPVLIGGLVVVGLLILMRR